MDNKIGSLEVGKRFDAIVVDTSTFPEYITEDETEDQIFERFVRCGSSANIVEVYVDGVQRINKVKPSREKLIDSFRKSAKIEYTRM